MPEHADDDHDHGELNQSEATSVAHNILLLDLPLCGACPRCPYMALWEGFGSFLRALKQGEDGCFPHQAYLLCHRVSLEYKSIDSHVL